MLKNVHLLVYTRMSSAPLDNNFTKRKIILQQEWEQTCCGVSLSCELQAFVQSEPECDRVPPPLLKGKLQWSKVSTILGRRRSISKPRRRTRISVFILYGNVFGQVVLVARRIPGSNLCTKQIFYRRCPAYQSCFFPGGVLEIQTYRHAVKIKTDGDRHYGICFDTRQYSALCLLRNDRLRETHKLEQRFVGLHHGHRKTGGHRDELSRHLRLGAGLHQYRFHGIACACGRRLSSKLVTLCLLLLQPRGSCPV
jgi:hypothetical protein